MTNKDYIMSKMKTVRKKRIRLMVIMIKITTTTMPMMLMMPIHRKMFTFKFLYFPVCQLCTNILRVKCTFRYSHKVT